VSQGGAGLASRGPHSRQHGPDMSLPLALLLLLAIAVVIFVVLAVARRRRRPPQEKLNEEYVYRAEPHADQVARHPNRLQDNPITDVEEPD